MEVNRSITQDEMLRGSFPHLCGGVTPYPKRRNTMARHFRKVHDRIICHAKRNYFGNWFNTRQEAERDAIEREQIEGKCMHAYRCPHCRNYHSGRDIKRELRCYR